MVLPTCAPLRPELAEVGHKCLSFELQNYAKLMNAVCVNTSQSRQHVGGFDPDTE